MSELRCEVFGRDRPGVPGVLAVAVPDDPGPLWGEAWTPNGLHPRLRANTEGDAQGHVGCFSQRRVVAVVQVQLSIDQHDPRLGTTVPGTGEDAGHHGTAA